MTQSPRRSASRRNESSPAGERQRGKSSRLPFALLGSVLVHLGIMLLVLPPRFDVFVPAEPKDEKPFEVTTVVEEEEAEDDFVAQNLPDNQRETPEVKELDEEEEPEEEEEDEKEEEPEVEPEETPPQPQPPPPPPELNRKVVQQESTDEEEPEQADHLAEKANRVDEETQARETTELDVLAGKTVPDDLVEVTGGDDESRADEAEAEQEQVADSDEAPAGEEVEEEVAKPELAEPEPVLAEPPTEQQASEQSSPDKTEEGDAPALETPEESPFATKSSPETSDAEEAYEPPPRALFQPTQKDYDAVFGEADKKAASTVNQHKEGRRLLKGWKKREAAMRASLENVNLEVRPGNHTGVNASAAVYATFISRIHRKLHPRWGAGYLPRLESDYGPGHPLSNPRLEVTIEYILDAASGEVEATNIVKTSGETMYDAEAIVIFNEIGPHTGAPDEIISPDGKVYIHWTLWRNQQQCGPWGASIFMVDNGTKKRIDQGGNAGGDASQSGGR